MRKIKWENISIIIMVVLDILSVVSHIKLNGLYIGLVGELVIYPLMTFGVYYIVKDIRKNPKNWI